MRRLIIKCALVGIACLNAPGMAEDAPSPAAGGPEYNLTSYLKGTAPQVRDRLNGEVERLIVRLKESQTALADCDKDIANDTKAAIEKARKSDLYRQTLAEKTRAEQELEIARKSGTPQERLQAGSRFNKARLTIEKMENDAVLHSEALAQDRNHSYDIQRQIKRFKESLDRAVAWRTELLNAIRTTYGMRGPLKDGSKGVLPLVTVAKVVDADHLLVRYDAPELISKGKEAEGIQSYSARFYHTTILVPLDTKNIKTGDKINIDHVYVIDGSTHTEDRGTVFSAKRLENETDVLFDTIVPLRESITSDTSGKLNQKNPPKSE